MLTSPLVRYNHMRHDCGSEASVTDIFAGSDSTTTNVLANLTEMYVTNMPAVSEQTLKTWVLQQA